MYVGSFAARVCLADDPLPCMCIIVHRNPTTGGWRAIKLVDGTLCPPAKEGWGDGTYVVVLSAPKPSSDANGSETESGLGGFSAATNAPSVGKFLPSLFKSDRDSKLVCGSTM